MKVRIGFGLGTGGIRRPEERFAGLVSDLERLGFDSLWLSERITTGAIDPVVGMAFAAGRTSRLKLGMSVMVLPGRNPALVAKQLASLDRLSGGRLLPAFGLGVADPSEQQAFGVERWERAPWFDEALPLIRRMWVEDELDHDGPRFHYRALTIGPKPIQSPLEVWLGGRAPSELRRVGRLGDGWLPSFSGPEDVRLGRKLVEEAAVAEGRALDPEHFGALIAYVHGEIPERLERAISVRRPEVDPADLVPSGVPALRDRIEQFVEVGASKFVVVCAVEPKDWTAELDELASLILPLQSR
jgi:probable F420-dependent oxidoreductase